MVKDLQAAKEWYSKAFNAQPYFDEPFYIGFNIGGYELGLHPAEEVKSSEGNSVTYWGVDDVDKEFERLISLGASEHEKPQDVGGEIKVAAVKDPWGNPIGIIYNPHFKIS